MSSLEVNENQDNKNPEDCDLLKYHPSAFCRGVKRKEPLVDGKEQLPNQSHVTCKKAAWAVSQKNAVVQLNELRPGLQYHFLSKSGHLHAPQFSVAVEVNGLTFQGSGPSKKQAKMKAAQLALRSFIQFPNASQAHAAMGSFSSTTVDFTADQLDNSDSELLLHCSSANQEVLSRKYKHRPLLRLSLDFLSSDNPIRPAGRASLLQRFNPVALLNELRPGLRYICLMERVHGRAPGNFIMVVKVKGRVFEGCGHSKRVAKAQAAAVALHSLFNIDLGPQRTVVGPQRTVVGPQRTVVGPQRTVVGPQRAVVGPQRMVVGPQRTVVGPQRAVVGPQRAVVGPQRTVVGPQRAVVGPQRTIMGQQGCRSKDQLPQFFTEFIFHLVTQKYSELTNSCFTSNICYKGLAGIIMTRGFDLRSAQVVCLSTGTKCVDVDSETGLSLRDCHAEVISRRALVRFLYTQIELLLCKPADGEGQSIFEPNKSCGSFRLKDDILFHMYISSSPCGDARLNCPYETKATYGGRRFRCHLRVKVDGGEGTLPVRTWTANHKWNGVSPGEPLTTMSCTDKITKWSVVGLQGALLSHLLEPVYLHSLTVGTLSHTGHLDRTISRRLTVLRHLPFPYRRRQLLLGYLNSSELRPSGKSTNISMNWSFGDEGLEEICTSSGRRTDTGTPSRLCRSVMFTRWQQIQQQISGEEMNTTYYGSKMAAGCYQRALEKFTVALQGAGLGTWNRKHPNPGHGGLC